MTRKVAQTYQGKPCKYGHSGIRYITGTCYECAKIARKKWVENHPEQYKELLKKYRASDKRKAVMRRYYEKHRDEILDKCREQNKTNGEQRAEWKMLLRYKLTPADYLAILKRQGGLCAICRIGPPFKSKNGKLQVDHDHKTGKVRGLLCVRCNLGLSYLEDKPFGIMARLYLKYPSAE